MAKTQRERAFLRDLYINADWTRRFTELFDKHLDLSKAENILYINAGTGNHCLALREKIGNRKAIFATCEDEDNLHIARDKAAAVSSDIDFSTIRFEDNAFDTVLADATFVPPSDIGTLVDEAARVARIGGDVAIVLPTFGSFGEIFSLLWEVFFNEELGEHGADAEALVAELPSTLRLEQMAAKSSLVNIKTQTANEIFEYENGAEFIASPLIADFLLPEWLKNLDEDQKDRAARNLVSLIDVEDGTLTYRFSVKATLLTGEKS